MTRFRRMATAAILAALLTGLLPAIGGSAGLTGRVQAQDASWTSVIIELTAPAAAEVFATATAASQTPDNAGQLTAADMNRIAALTAAQVAAVAAEQEAFAATLDAVGAVEIYRVQRVYNGIAVRLPAAALATLRTDARVRAILPLVAKQPDNARAVPLIGAPALWSAPAGLTGAGVRIGIIDTGVDYLHVGLGGPGVGYDNNDTTIIGDVPGFPNARVVQGYDFVGDTYNANPSIFPYQPTPVPDPDPMDCYGHGTHVAGSAAGNGVTTAGAGYFGPYSGTLDTSAMRIGPGVAPRALIYALKVFGCVGSSEVVDLAVDWAIDPNGDGNFGDHLDILNLSLGSPFGNVNDSTSLAVDRAAQVGIVVVASMGNSGDTYFVAGSPGVSARAVSVAATDVAPDLQIVGGSQTDVLAGFSARGPRLGDNLLKPDLAAPGYDIASVYAGTGNGVLTISGTSMASPMVAGSLALLQQRSPLWDATQLKALLMNTAAAVVRMDADYVGRLAAPTRAGAGRVALDEALRSEIIALSPDTAGAVALSFGAPEVLGNSNALRNLRVQSYAAEARTLVAQYVPVIDVPGVDIHVGAALAGTTVLTVAAGASVSLPIVLAVDANAMTNLRDPALLPQQAGVERQWRSEEQGNLWLWDARGIFTATLSGAQATPPSANPATAQAQIRFNPASGVLSYTVASAMNVATIEAISVARGLPGHSLPDTAHTLWTRNGGPSVTLPLTGAVTLDARDALLLASGYLQIVIDANGGAIAGALRAQEPVLKTPLFAAPRPVAAMQSTSSTLAMGTAATLTATFGLTGTPLTGAAFPTDTQSLVGVFELHARSPQVPPDSGYVTPPFADIQFIGVSSDYQRVVNKNDARIFFAIGVWGEWSTPWQTQFAISLDIDEDNISDFRLFTTDVAEVSNGRYSDTFIAAVEDQGATGVTLADPLNLYLPGQRLTAIFQNNVIVISAPMAQLGLSAANSDFRFHVESLLRAPLTNEFGDMVQGLHFDAQRPSLAIRNMAPGSPWFEDLPGTQLQLGYDLRNFTSFTAQGLLLIHPFNGFGARAEAVDVTFAWPYVRQLPLVTTTGF